MSWMDSWSRPSKHSATPPPIYLTHGEDAVAYCHTCGRVLGSRRMHVASSVIKYCSDRCRHHKPGATDKRIEDAFLAFLTASNEFEGQPIEHIMPSRAAKNKKAVKGDPRITVDCVTVEELIFGSRSDPAKVYGRKKNRASRALATDDGMWRSVDMEDDGSTEDETASLDGGNGNYTKSFPKEGQNRSSATRGPLIRPAQTESDVNGSVGGEKGWAERGEETAEALERRLEGQKRVEEREMVRRAARRGCAFGFVIPQAEGGSIARERETKNNTRRSKNQARADEEKHQPDQTVQSRKCEAVMNGIVVEPSFAKGDWAIRWRA